MFSLVLFDEIGQDVQILLPPLVQFLFQQPVHHLLGCIQVSAVPDVGEWKLLHQLKVGIW